MKMMTKIANMSHRMNQAAIEAEIANLLLEHETLLLKLEQEENKTTGRKWIELCVRRIELNEYHTEIAQRALRYKML
jgi:hypothetical protein